MTDGIEPAASQERVSEHSPGTVGTMANEPTHEASQADEPVRLAIYWRMLEIRYLEKRAYDLFLSNLVRGTTHLSIGYEAISAAFATAMRPDDFTFATYRGHGHAIARGTSMTGILAELMGRGNGVVGGMGGSMHITSV